VERRNQLSQQLPANSVAIIPGAREQIRNGDVHYPFRQNSYFYYLTGFSEPDALLVLRTNASKTPEYILFLRPNDSEKELWNGKRLGIEGAKAELGAHIAYPIGDLNMRLKELLADQKNIYHPFKQYAWCDELMKPMASHDLTVYLSDLRLRKTEEEIQCMQKAVDISVEAHIQGMKACKPDMFEYELAAEYLYIFAKEGSNGPAYPPIVAGGENACILHYTQNKSRLKSGDLVLVDAAAEYENYSADITRTFPVNGKFTNEQRAIYEIVLKAQQSVIDALRPGVSYGIAQKIATHVITEGLLELGLLQGNLEELLEKKAYLPFYMHGCSHWLGLDTHDCGVYKTMSKEPNPETHKNAADWRDLEEGMVLTVEPGIYIRPESGVDKKWHHIGIRIEDDVLITANGCRVMSEAAPKKIDEIESLMK
jgi:Xaa-Pro aminopeptidase